MGENVIVSSFKSLREHLDEQSKRRGILVLCLIFISSILDVFGLASLIPVILAASKPGFIHTNKYFNYFYESLGFTNEKNFLVFLISAVFVFFLVKNLFSLWIYYKQAKFTASVGLKLNDKQFTKYYSLPFWEFNHVGSSKIMSHVNQAPNAFVTGILQPLIVFISETTMVAIIVIGIAVYQPSLFVILAIVLGPSTYLIFRYLKNRSSVIGYQLEQMRIVDYSVLNDSFMGYVELKLANKQAFFQNKYIQNQAQTQKLKADFYLYNLIPAKAIETIAVLGVVTIFLFSLFFSNDPAQLITLIGLFAAAAYRLMPSINKILSALMSMRNSQYTIDILNLFSEEAKENHAKIKNQLGTLHFASTIEFKNITFYFPKAESPALKNISLQVNKGDKIGLIGTSGSGKTTLMNVLLRFYIEQEGEIVVDGHKLQYNNINAWRDLIGYVKQDIFVMNSSLKDNITLGDKAPDLKRIQQAVELASLGEFVKSLPEGIETKLGEKGSRLSGGQRQRIGIARALYKNSEILVLDEATSALDNETEREVTEAIYNLSSTDITMFIIAHRITTLKDCNKIYELKNGEIIKEHIYADLISKMV
ncbi:ABC transporter ATP-binding protein [Rufibacter ruber]|uniref:ABC transporter ATP-binding protein n=1 Tax=Rufibacter ruber TaxID=1783499 RepID=UPI000833823F|nr:ABC transporter ATP-binding protein [Rufibacter ruber]